MSRPSFRARPIDVNQSLAIIREALDADQVVAREVTHGHQTLDAENEEVRRRPAPRDTSSMGVTLERAEPGTDRRSRPTRSKKPTWHTRGRFSFSRTFQASRHFSHFFRSRRRD